MSYNLSRYKEYQQAPADRQKEHHQHLDSTSEAIGCRVFDHGLNRLIADTFESWRGHPFAYESFPPWYITTRYGVMTVRNMVRIWSFNQIAPYAAGMRPTERGDHYKLEAWFAGDARLEGAPAIVDVFGDVVFNVYLDTTSMHRLNQLYSLIARWLDLLGAIRRTPSKRLCTIVIQPEPVLLFNF